MRIRCKVQLHGGNDAVAKTMSPQVVFLPQTDMFGALGQPQLSRLRWTDWRLPKLNWVASSLAAWF